MRTVLACLLTLLSLSPAFAGPPRTSDGVYPRRLQPGPNVVLILTDDMGYADLGCYGCKDIRTPNIDRLAKEGTRLTDFYSNGPVCTPTRAALMTGRWQQRVGLEWAIYPGQKEPGLPTRETCLARMLRSAGYRTGMFGKWHLGYRKEFGPNAHGFETFAGLLSGNIDHYSKKEINGESDWYEDTTPKEAKGYSTDLITTRAVDFIDRHAKERFFLYLPYNAVHWPFQPPDKPGDIRTRPTWLDGTRKDYAAMLQRIDQGVGKVLAAVDRHEIASDTLVIFTNDNGGERLSDNGPFFHHKATLWEGGIRVPCILRWKDHVPAGKVSAQAGISMDLAATVLAACGVKPPAGRKLDGIDLLPYLQGDRTIERTFFWRITRPDHNQRAVRHGHWKYVRDSGYELLFDLSADPGERKILAYQRPEKVAELRQKLAEWEKEMAKEKPTFVVK
jgi:arylsulfatase A-like enzyme